MKLLRDRGRRGRGKAIPSLFVFLRKESAAWPANRLVQSCSWRRCLLPEEPLFGRRTRAVPPSLP